jgi:TRAP-type C4-dicarboxylate transport system substrate-binding protein
VAGAGRVHDDHDHQLTALVGMSSQYRVVRTSAGVGVALALVSGACSGGGDKAGGDDRTAPVVLTLASNQAFLPGQLAQFPADVDRLSGGTVRIEFKGNWRVDQPDQEMGLITDVQAGQADLAWVGSRVFDEVGVTSLQPLVAPFLIDSYDLEGKVFDSGLPQQMLQGLDAIGLTGVGILPGPMRRLTGVTHPFAKHTDFDGAVMGTSGGQLAEDTFTAVGATPQLVSVGTPLDGLDGLDFQLNAILDNRYFEHASYVTGNIDLWPRPLVVFANAARFAQLPVRQQQVIRDALAGEVGSALDASRREDEKAGPGLCTAGMTVVEAPFGDVSSLHGAVSSLMRKLTADPGLKASVDAIQALKTQLNAPAESLTCPSSSTTPRPSPPTPLDGVYEMTDTEADITAVGEFVVPENWGSWVRVFDRGRFATTQENPGLACTWAYGTYIVNSDRVELLVLDGGTATPTKATNKPGEDFVYGWSLYRDELTLTVVPGKESPPGDTAKPWHRLDVAPTLAALNQHCPPPDKALWSPANASSTTTTA